MDRYHIALFIHLLTLSAAAGATMTKPASIPVALGVVALGALIAGVSASRAKMAMPAGASRAVATN